MPFTFFSHQAPVVPLKIAWPHLFSGQALVLGSMAPDFQFFLTGSALWGAGHSIPGQFTFCLPITLLMVGIVSGIVARPLALHLPEGGVFHLHDYRVLADTPRHLVYWFKVIPSALIGSFSHIAWDSFTHPNGWSAREFEYADTPLFYIGSHPILIVKLAQHGSTLLGGLFTLIMLHYIGKNRLLLHWAGNTDTDPDALPTPASRRLLWTPPVFFALLGFGIHALLAHHAHFGFGMRFWSFVLLRTATSGFVGLCLGCLLCTRKMQLLLPSTGIQEGSFT